MSTEHASAVSTDIFKINPKINIQFPEKLYRILISLPVSLTGMDFIQTGGVALLNPVALKNTLHTFFRTNKLPSFRRNLNMYGFKCRNGNGNQYYHADFFTGNLSKIKTMKRKRQAVLANKSKQPSVKTTNEAVELASGVYANDVFNNVVHNDLHIEKGDTDEGDTDHHDYLIVSAQSFDTFSDDTLYTHTSPHDVASFQQDTYTPTFHEFPMNPPDFYFL